MSLQKLSKVKVGMTLYALVRCLSNRLSGNLSCQHQRVYALSELPKAQNSKGAFSRIQLFFGTQFLIKSSGELLGD